MKINYNKDADLISIVFAEVPINKSIGNAYGITRNYDERGDFISLEISLRATLESIQNRLFDFLEVILKSTKQVFQKKLNKPLFRIAKNVRNKYRSLSSLGEQNEKIAKSNLNHFFVRIAQNNLRKYWFYTIFEKVYFLVLLSILLTAGLNDISILHPGLWRLPFIEIIKLLLQDFERLSSITPIPFFQFLSQFSIFSYTFILATIYGFIFTRLVPMFFPKKWKYFPDIIMTVLLIVFYGFGA